VDIPININTIDFKGATIMSSKEYFEKVAEEWDEMRREFFSEEVREKAYEMAQIEEEQYRGRYRCGHRIHHRRTPEKRCQSHSRGSVPRDVGPDTQKFR